MYQNTNRDLQRNMSTTSGASTSIATDHSTLEADNSNNVDGSLIEDTEAEPVGVAASAAHAGQGQAPSPPHAMHHRKY